MDIDIILKQSPKLLLSTQSLASISSKQMEKMKSKSITKFQCANSKKFPLLNSIELVSYNPNYNIESEQHPLKGQLFVGNAFLAARPDSPLLANVIRSIMSHDKQQVWTLITF